MSGAMIRARTGSPLKGGASRYQRSSGGSPQGRFSLQERSQRGFVLHIRDLVMVGEDLDAVPVRIAETRARRPFKAPQDEAGSSRHQRPSCRPPGCSMYEISGSPMRYQMVPIGDAERNSPWTGKSHSPINPVIRRVRKPACAGPTPMHQAPGSGSIFAGQEGRRSGAAWLPRG